MIKTDHLNESNDYLKCYHFLEGISKYNEWYSLIDNETNNKRIKSDTLKNHFLPEIAIDTFDKLIKKFRNSKIVISYKFGGVPSIYILSNILKKYKKNIHIYQKHYLYALNKQNGNAVLNREYILIGE